MRKNKNLKILNTIKEPENKRVLLDVGHDHDKWLIINTIEKSMIALWEYEGIEKKQSLLIEKLLFKHGTCVVFKLPNDDLYISNYIMKEKDIYDIPTKIQIINPGNKLDNKIINNNFAILYNNSTKTGTLRFLMHRLNMVTKALRYVDKEIPLSNTLIGVGKDVDDATSNLIMDQLYGGSAVVNIPEEFLRSGDITTFDFKVDITGKIQAFEFELNTLLTFLGFKTGGLVQKNEKQTELEVASNDKFDGLILQDMYNIRLMNIDELKNIGINITINKREPEMNESSDNGEVQNVQNNAENI